MKNFIAFLKRFQVLTFFLILQGVAMFFYFSYSQFPRSKYLTTATYMSGSLYEMRNGVTKHFDLSENNADLTKQNIELLEKQPLSFISLNKKYVTIDDTLYSQKYSYIPGLIIQSTHTAVNNYFTINIGRAQNIQKGMGVISAKGIVGKIHAISEHYAVVKSCLTDNSNFDIIIEKTGQFGSLSWDGTNFRKGSMNGVSNDVEVKKWSKIVTRGGGGIFPRGIPVGMVTETKTVEGKPLWDITLKFAVDFSTVQNIYVVKNIMLDEQRALENQIPQ